MYHIKPDKRSQASAAEIVKGLQECLKTTPLKAVTVSDLHRATGISRATFYRLFDTPEDVLRYQFDQILNMTFSRYSLEEKLTPRQVFEDNLMMGMEQHDFVRALLDNERIDLLLEYTESLFRSQTIFSVLFPQDVNSVEREYILSHLSMIMVSTLITWEKNGRKETAAELMQYLRHYVQLMSQMIEGPA